MDVPNQSLVNVESLLDRAFLFLEDGDWASADEYCERVLDIESRNALGYLGKLMARLRVSKREQLGEVCELFDSNADYQKILRFGDEVLVAEVKGYLAAAEKNKEAARLDAIYASAVKKMHKKTQEGYREAAQVFGSIPGWRDADEKAANCVELEEKTKKDAIYASAVEKMDKETQEGYRDAAQVFGSIPGWRDADEKAANCVELEEKIKKDAVYDSSLAMLTNIKGDDVRDVDTVNKAIEGFASTPLINSGWMDVAAVSAGGSHTVALKSDGTVVVSESNGYGQRKVSDWTDIVAVSAGGRHTVALKSDGTVVAAGYNEDGRGNVSDWTDMVAVSAGQSHTVGLKSDGTVVATGDNDEGQSNVSGWTDIVAVSARHYHTVALKSDGTVVARGSNGYGKCDVSGWTDIVAISAGGSHTVALKSDGTVVAIGYNYYGQCNVSGWRNVVAVSTGHYHTVALKSDGTVVATGNNYDGQCNVSGWRDIVAVSAGERHTVALKSDGTVVTTGSDNGQCNNGGLSDSEVRIAEIKQAIEGFASIPGWRDSEAKIGECRAIIADIEQAIAKEKQQAEYDRARAEYAQEEKKGKIKRSFLVGIPATVFVILLIVTLVTRVIPEMRYRDAVEQMNGSLEGNNIEYAMLFGKVGDYKDARDRSYEFWKESGRMVAVSAGLFHTVALKSDGTVVATGANKSGQCNVSSWTDIVSVSAGVLHSVGLKSDGTVVATGNKTVGQCDVSGWTNIVAVSTGNNHTVGLKSNGTVVAAGDNDNGECDVSGWTDIVAVSARSFHTVGLKSDGTVVATKITDDEWDFGQCDVSGWTDIVAVSAGDDYTVGLKSDGTVVATGYNYYGQCDVSGWTDIVAVSAGDVHTVGLKSDGTVVATSITNSDNDMGQSDVSGWTDIMVP